MGEIPRNTGGRVMTGADELSRLRQQAADAQASLNGLVERREASLDGCGWSPSPADIDRARDRAEAAQRLLEAHVRMAARS